MISQEKWTILTPLQKLPKNVGDWGKLIVATDFEKLPKVQKIALSGHTEWEWESERLNGRLLELMSHCKREERNWIGLGNIFDISFVKSFLLKTSRERERSVIQVVKLFVRRRS